MKMPFPPKPIVRALTAWAVLLAYATAGANAYAAPLPGSPSFAERARERLRAVVLAELESRLEKMSDAEFEAKRSRALDRLETIRRGQASALLTARESRHLAKSLALSPERIDRGLKQYLEGSATAPETELSTISRQELLSRLVGPTRADGGKRYHSPGDQPADPGKVLFYAILILCPPLFIIMLIVVFCTGAVIPVWT